MNDAEKAEFDDMKRRLEALEKITAPLLKQQILISEETGGGSAEFGDQGIVLHVEGLRKK